MNTIVIEIGEGEKAKTFVLVERATKKGRFPGRKFYGPDPKVWTLDHYIDLFGAQKVLEDLIQPRINSLCLNYTKEATDEKDGIIDQDSLKSMFCSLSARGETLANIEERIMQLMMDITEANGNEERDNIIEKIRNLKKEYEKKKDRSEEVPGNANPQVV